MRECLYRHNSMAKRAPVATMLLLCMLLFPALCGGDTTNLGSSSTPPGPSDPLLTLEGLNVTHEILRAERMLEGTNGEKVGWTPR